MEGVSKLELDSQFEDSNEFLLRKLEQKIGCSIPDEISAILVNPEKLNLTKNSFKRNALVNFKQGMTIERILSFKEIDQALEVLEDDNEFIGNRLLPFGESMGSPIICISLHNDYYGSVFVFDDDFGATKEANSLADFLNSLS